MNRDYSARNKVKLRDNKARTQPTSRSKPNWGSIRMNDNIGPAYHSTLASLAKSVFKSTAYRSYAIPLFQVDHSERARMTDVQGAVVTS